MQSGGGLQGWLRQDLLPLGFLVALVGCVQFIWAGRWHCVSGYCVVRIGFMVRVVLIGWILEHGLWCCTDTGVLCRASVPCAAMASACSKQRVGVLEPIHTTTQWVCLEPALGRHLRSRCLALLVI
jgi:hypothetical protein